MFKFSVACFLLMLGITGVKGQYTIDVTSSPYNAVNDSATLNTTAIQNAINAVSAHTDAITHIKGGIVLIPKQSTGLNKYRSGSIRLKSNVELRIDSGATLLGSTNFYDYSKNIAKDSNWYALVLADTANNIAVTGKGIIDGQGDTLGWRIDTLIKNGHLNDPNYTKSNRPDESLRPQLFEFIKCNGVRVHNINLKRSSCWVESYRYCRNLTIDSIKVNSTAYWNNDGLDLTDCNTVTLNADSINASDDGICLKSYNKDSSCKNITVTNCTVRSSANGFKIGTTTLGGFKNITVNNLKVYDTYRTAISLEIVDGGSIDSTNISNVTVSHSGGALFIRQGFRKTSVLPGLIKNVRISHLNADIATDKPDAGYNYPGPPVTSPVHNAYPSSIVGLPGYQIQNVTLDTIQINFGGGGNRDTAYVPLSTIRSIPEHEQDYPEYSMFGELPAWGIYARHVKGLTYRNIKLSYKNTDFRSAMLFDDVDTVKLLTDTIASTPISSYKTDLANGGVGDTMVYLNDVKKDSVVNLNTPAGPSIARNNLFLASKNFTPNNFVVVKVGSGTSSLDSTATYANLIEYDTSGNQTGASLMLNNKVSGRVTLGGSSIQEGGLNLTQDCRYLLIGGYDSPLGTDYPSTMKKNKVIACVPYNKVVDYTTSIPAANGYDSSTIRAVTGCDSTKYWVLGGPGTSAGKGGIKYILHGTGAVTNIDTVSRYKWVNFFHGQLDFTDIGGVKYFAARKPVTTSTSAYYNDTTGNSNLSQGFVMLKMPGITGNADSLAVMYVAKVGTNGGVYKYYYNGTGWIKPNSPTFFTVSGGIIAITGRVNANGHPEFYAIVGSNSNNKIMSFIDSGANSEKMRCSTPKVLDSARTNYIFKSIAFSPDSVVHTVYASPQKLAAAAEIAEIEKAVMVYPNPAKGNITIAHPVFNKPTNVRIIGLNGRVSKNYTIQQGVNQTQLHVDDLSTGVYIVVISNNDVVYTTRFVKSNSVQ
ncbi:glycosyl hydrolase family 28 protein [Parasediminibacterium sp. JCM 36343]|uniref:glycosyl hydrolase family 28 protein n=1 Tax=Parasediminibacterium sp. JCM 36343 TaxID=3374279 RepID=UPI00397C9C3A